MTARRWLVAGFILVVVAVALAFHANWRDAHHEYADTNPIDHGSAVARLLTSKNDNFDAGVRSETDAARAIGVIGVAAFGVALVISINDRAGRVAAPPS